MMARVSTASSKGFMIQGGDPLTKDPAMESRWGTVIRVTKSKRNSMISRTCAVSFQWRVRKIPIRLGRSFSSASPMRGFWTGNTRRSVKLIKGDDVLGKIGDTPVGQSNSGERSKPMTRVSVESVKIVPADSVK